jgi:hypothetical protein
VAQAAVRCIYADQEVPGRGLWQFQLRQVAYRELARLTTALKRRSVTPPASLVCGVPGIPVQPFVLRGRNGQIVAPQLPTTACGMPQQQALTALRALHWETVAARRGVLAQTQAGLSSGCPAAWKDMIGQLAEIGHGRALRPSRGGPVFTPRPAWLRICTYRDRSGPLDTYLLGGGRVSGATEQPCCKVLILAASLPPVRCRTAPLQC